MNTLVTDGAPYDRLYRAKRGPLWFKAGRVMPLVLDLMPAGSTVFDAGCGDGKNALPLLRRGHEVFGCDTSRLAIAKLRERFAAESLDGTNFVVGDAFRHQPVRHSVDALISYGLLHCVPREHRVAAHLELQACVRPGGLIVFSALMNTLEMPEGHETPEVDLVAVEEVDALFSRHRRVHSEFGSIVEDHLPVVGTHQHHASWIVARVP